jgi:hypothetical protein
MPRRTPAAGKAVAIKRFHQRDVVAIAMDAVLYSTAKKPWSNGRSLGKPPDKVKAVQDRHSTSSQVFRAPDTHLPFAIEGDQCDTNVTESFRLLIEELNAKFEPSAHEAIPFSSTTHDRKNLEWGRDGVPLCAEGSMCKATALKGHHGPLGVYVTVAQDQAMQQGRPVAFPEDALCLLCYRANARHMQVACEASGRELDHAMIPPFQNFFNTKGGYKEAHMGACIPVSGTGVVRIASMTRDLQVRVHPRASGRFYVDQTAIEYTDGPTDSLRSVTPPACAADAQL